MIYAIVGFLLNVVGTAMAGLALYQENRKHHGKTILPTAEVAEWVRVRVRRRQPRLTKILSERATAWEVFEVRASGIVKPAADAALDEHVEYLWRQVESLGRVQEQDRTEILAKVGAVNATLSERVGHAEERITQSENAIRGMATGSFRMEVWGLVLVGLGSAVALAPVLLGWS